MLRESESIARQLGVTKIDTIEQEDNAAEKEFADSKEKEVDTIVVGSRGFSTAEEFLL